MRSSLMIVALLCFIAWMSLAHASTHGRVSSCCLRWSNTSISHSRIRHYTIQKEGVCPIQAVVFHTVRNKRICSNPEDSWTIKTILVLDQRQASKMQGNKAEESRSTITPTASEKRNTFHDSTTMQVLDKLEDTTLTPLDSDPDGTWTATAVMKADKESEMLQMKGNKAEDSTSIITPTPSAVSERFRTGLNKQPGPDPDSTWTTTPALKTDKESQMLQMKGNNEDGSATTVTPTVSSSSKSKPKRKGRRPGRRLRKKNRSGRKWMKKVHVTCEHSLSVD